MRSRVDRDEEWEGMPTLKVGGGASQVRCHPHNSSTASGVEEDIGDLKRDNKASLSPLLANTS